MNYKVFKILIVLVLLTACAVADPQQVMLAQDQADLEHPDRAKLDKKLLEEAIKEPPGPEKTKALLGEVGKNWLYGQGVGETMLNLGLIVAFPPYALVVATNLGLTLANYQPLSISRALPEPASSTWSTTYDTVTSVPGQLSAAVAGEEFRNKHISSQQIHQVLEREDQHFKVKEELK